MAGTGGLLSLLLTVCWALGVSLAAHQDCLDIPTESHFQPEDVEGTWYPVEIVLHRNDSKIYGVPVASHCPVVTISKNKRALVMVWNATDGDVKFSFTQKVNNRLAQWQANGEQAGSLVNDQYKHFGGVVKVLKVDSKYVFLSFCSSKFRMLSTVALSRDETMSEEDFKQTLAVLDTRSIKRAREIHVRPCEEEPSGQTAVSSWFLVVLLSCALPALWSGH